MNNLKTLSDLFKDKIFRIPDYQRGYAWQEKQWEEFWDDLINLSDDREHYTGVITLKENSKENQSVNDVPYKGYNIVDGQQRLTTAIILIKVFIDIIVEKIDDRGIADEFKSTETEKYLVKANEKGLYSSYKFGYTKDDPSDDYFKCKILGDDENKSIDETFYTLNLKNAKEYF